LAKKQYIEKYLINSEVPKEEFKIIKSNTEDKVNQALSSKLEQLKQENDRLTK